MKNGRLGKVSLVCLVIFLIFPFSQAQENPKPKATTASPVAMLTKGMTERLSSSLDVKQVVGDPIKVGKVTIVPIIMVDVGFGGGGGGAPGAPQMGAFGYGMGAEARPLGFVIISKSGAKFVPVGKIPRK